MTTVTPASNTEERTVSAYTALSSARGRTELHVIAEPSAAQRERESYGPAEPTPTLQDTADATRRALLRRLAEPLAIEQLRESAPHRADWLTDPIPVSREGAQDRSTTPHVRRDAGRVDARTPPLEPDWRKLQSLRQSLEQGHHLQR